MTDSAPILGTPFAPGSTRVLFCGAGELGREVVIELKRLGCEVIAVDRYANAPGMQVADRSHVIDMLDPVALRRVILEEKPHLVVPEIEAIATDSLVQLEAEGQRVVPTARAARLTMHREGIRRLAAEELGLATSSYRFADDYASFAAAVREVGFPCVVKPVMSSSGKGQSVLRAEADVQSSWDYAQAGGRAGAGRVIVEGFIDFDYEITLLTVRHAGGTSFCDPIGHLQIDGDYRESWQPQPMSTAALEMNTPTTIGSRRSRSSAASPAALSAVSSVRASSSAIRLASPWSPLSNASSMARTRASSGGRWGSTTGAGASGAASVGFSSGAFSSAIGSFAANLARDSTRVFTPALRS